jgi:hypothetical protein
LKKLASIFEIVKKLCTQKDVGFLRAYPDNRDLIK